ncbi:MAG: hypothetical protein AMJ54_13100 [Deltaproteobacteria bacterium SG8_13]|nr:MAG: hypothetical protein AMJ54_13100 [Deltaproteobacteria bacterium SG8_13]
MIVQVKISGIICDPSARRLPVDAIDIHLPREATVNDLLQRLNLSKPGEIVVAVNRKVQQPDTPLNNGDCVTILPVVEGG